MAFGSCYNHPGTKVPGSTEIFLSVKNLEPDWFVWLGDFTYTDNFSFFGGFYPNNISTIIERFDESYYDLSKPVSCFFELLRGFSVF